MRKILAGASALLYVGCMSAAEYPSAEIKTNELQVKAYLPDAEHGYYRGTRFDWSGVLNSLEYKGHNYYGPWFDRTNPSVHDFIYEGSEIVAGACSAISGPVDEFGEVGWDEAKPGANFLKIGVGALRKPADGQYDNYTVYEIANPGKWTVRQHPDSLEFIQELSDPSSGYSYIYRKTIRLAQGKPEMVLEHSIENRGTRAIRTSVYNHNFLVLDKQPPGPGVTISLPFQIHTSHPAQKELAEIQGNKIVYLKTLAGHDVAAMPVEGFGNGVGDNMIRIENSRLGAGMTIQADRPLAKLALWSIRSVLAMEPFVSIDVEPGQEFSWKTTYEYYSH